LLLALTFVFASVLVLATAGCAHTVRINTLPAGAELYVNGTLVGPTPQSVPCKPAGEAFGHEWGDTLHVVLQMEGYETVEKTITSEDLQDRYEDRDCVQGQSQFGIGSTFDYTYTLKRESSSAAAKHRVECDLRVVRVRNGQIVASASVRGDDRDLNKLARQLVEQLDRANNAAPAADPNAPASAGAAERRDAAGRPSANGGAEMGGGSNAASADGAAERGGMAAAVGGHAGQSVFDGPLAVATLRDRTGSAKSRPVVEALTDKLAGALVAAGHFDVKERVNLRAILEERDLEAAALVENPRVREKLAGIDYLILGGVAAGGE
jgi:hypothetical protein